MGPVGPLGQVMEVVGVSSCLVRLDLGDHLSGVGDDDDTGRCGDQAGGRSARAKTQSKVDARPDRVSAMVTARAQNSRVESEADRTPRLWVLRPFAR